MRLWQKVTVLLVAAPFVAIAAWYAGLSTVDHYLVVVPTFGMALAVGALVALAILAIYVAFAAWLLSRQRTPNPDAPRR